MKQEEIIERLEMIREALGLNVTQFAEAAGISQGNMSAMLNNKRVIGEGIINKVCMELGVNKRYILTGEGNTFSDSIVTINDCDKLKYTENDNLKIHTEVIMSTINERIKKIIDVLYKGNVTAFANSVGFGASTIHAIVGKKQSTPSFPVLYAIYDSLHSDLGLSAHWLLTGEGEMIKNAETIKDKYLDVVMEKDRIIIEKDKVIMNLLELK